jgi:hypothetical protein
LKAYLKLEDRVKGCFYEKALAPASSGAGHYCSLYCIDRIARIAGKP